MGKVDNFQSSLQQCFTTPILVHNFEGSEALNRELKALLLEMEAAQPQRNIGSGHKSNIAGWRSGDDLLSNPAPCLQALTTRVTSALNGVMAMAPLKGRQGIKLTYNMFGWANVHRNGGYNTSHIHGDHHWSAVYYVDAGESDPAYTHSGRLSMHDPRPGSAMMPIHEYGFGNKFNIDPSAGTLVLFPSWIVHEVHPFIGSGTRISVAFNIRLNRVPQRQQKN